MPAPIVAGATNVVAGANVVLGITSKGWREATKLVQMLTGTLVDFRKGLFQAGVMTIYVDRLIQSFVRAWKFLNTVIGVGAVSSAAEQFKRIAQWTGEGTTRLQAFTAVAKEAGAGLDDVADLFQTIAERVDDLRSSQEKGIMEDFARFGLTAQSFMGAGDAFSMWLIIADKLSNLDPTKRLAMAEKILGGDLARRFGQLLENGVQGLGDLMREAMATGEVLSQQELDVAANFEKTKRRLQRIFTALSNQLGMAVIPSLEKIFTVISDVGFEFAKFVRYYTDLRGLISGFVPDLDKMKNFLASWGDLVMPIGETLWRIAMGFSAVLGLTYGPQAVSVLGYFTQMGVRVWKLLVILEDFVGFMRGDDSIFGKFLKSSPLLQEVWSKLHVAIMLFGDAIRRAKFAADDLFDGPIAIFAVRAAVTSLLVLAAVLDGMAMSFALMVNTAEFLVPIVKELAVYAGMMLSFMMPGLNLLTGLAFPVVSTALAGSVGSKLPDMYRAADPFNQGLTSGYEKHALGGLSTVTQHNNPVVSPSFHFYGDPGTGMQNALGPNGRLLTASLGQN